MQDILQLLSEPNLKNEDVYKKFISPDLKIVERTRSQNKSVCGGHIQTYTLSFQCYTCAPDPHHMFCASCFEKEKHINHKYVMRHNIGGCCDCGDELTINKEGFCKSHQGFNNQNSEQLVQQIPQQIQARTREFIFTISALMFKYMQESKDSFNQTIQLLKSFKKFVQDFEQITIAQEIDIFLQNQMEQDFDEKKYSDAVKLYKILFQQIRFLTSQNMPFILLITQQLMEQIPEEITKKIQYDNRHKEVLNYTLYENLVRFSTYFEDHADIKVESNDDIFFSFHANQNFKQYTQQVYLKLNEYYYRRQELPMELKQVQELQSKMKQIEQNYRMSEIKNTPQYIHMWKEYSLVFKKFLKSLKEEEVFVSYVKSEFHEHHTQFVAEEQQLRFFLSPHIENYYRNLEIFHNEITQCRMANITQLLLSINVLRLRFEYTFFTSISYHQLTQILGQQEFNSFTSKEIQPQNLSGEFYNYFTIARLIKIFSTQKETPKEKAPQFKLRPETIIYYQYFQQQALKIIGEAFKKLGYDPASSSFCRNISNVLFWQSFQGLQSRNKLMVNEKPEIPLMNSQLPDRIFIFFLVYQFYLNDCPEKKRFFEIIQNILLLSEKDFFNEYKHSLRRAVLSYIGGFEEEGQDQRNQNIYFGLTAPDQSNLYSCDISTIRFGIYLFGNEAIQIIIKEFSEQNSDHIDWLLRLVLTIMLTEHDLLNLVGPQYTELPKDLQCYFRKLVKCLFIIKNYTSYSAIVGQLESTLLVTFLQYEKIILEVCQQDQYIRELQLKPKLSKEMIYEPMIFLNSSKIRGKIQEKILELKDNQIDLTIGNSFQHDLNTYKNQETATLGELRASIIKNIIDSNLIFKIQVLENCQEEFLARFVHVFKLATQFFYPIGEDILKQEKLNHIFQSLDNISQNKQEKKIQKNSESEQMGFMQKLKSLFQIGKKSQVDDKQKQVEKNDQKEISQTDKKAKQLALMKAKFASKQAKFNDKFLKDSMQNEGKVDEKNQEFEMCQGCKLLITDEKTNQVCSPALIQFNNQSNFFPEPFYSKDQDLVMTCCQHIFHRECIINAFESVKNRGNLPVWVILSCPLCKSSSNLILPFCDNLNKEIIQQYFQDFMYFIYTNEDMVSFFSKEDEKTQEQVFLDCQEMIIMNQLWQLFINTQNFFNKRQHLLFQRNIKILRDFVEINKNNIQQKQVIEQEQAIKTLNQLIYEVSNTIMAWVQQNITLEIVVQKLSKFQNDPFFAKSNIQEAFTFIFEQIIQTPVQKNELMQIEDQPLQMKDTLVKYYKQSIGQNFNEMYNKYFPKACSYCNYYPKEFRDEFPAEIFLCMICFQVMCSQDCSNSNQMGNLNRHASEKHCDSTFYISITSGQVILMNSPISIQGFKYLFYDNLGRSINIQDSKIDWSTYLTDDRVLNGLIDILINYNLKTQVRSQEVKMQYLDTQGTI